MLVAIVAVILFILTIVWQNIQTKKFNRRWLRVSFGKKKDSLEDSLENIQDIARWYKLQEDFILPDEKVDDVTWNDLDMDRIFALMNHNTSSTGEQYMYKLLRQLKQDTEAWKQREEKICFFEREESIRLNVQMGLQALRKREIYYLIPEIVDTIEEKRLPFAKYSRVLLISLILLAVAAVVTGGNLYIVVLLGVNALVNLILYAVRKNEYEIYLQAVFAIVRIVKTAKLIEHEMGEIDESTRQALQELKLLSCMVDGLESAKQAYLTGDIVALLQDYLFGMLMWEFIVYDKVITELCGKKDAFMRVFSFVGETDTCIAIASFRRSLGEYCIPEWGGNVLSIKGLRHPLIDNAVKNDYVFTKNAIITGSNASGKSTFMKSVAVNIILAQTIHTCTAEEMCLSDMGVMTSMAVRDDVAEGESYYIKEIRYLKRMIDRSSGERRFFFCVDEILRGTNTKERIAASLSILKYMSEKNCVMMVATHDTELAKLLDGEYENYHFGERFQDRDVQFDFKLRSGITETSNAILLLDVVGFPKEIVEQAEQQSVIC